MQSVYSTAPTDWICMFLCDSVFFKDLQCVFLCDSVILKIYNDHSYLRYNSYCKLNPIFKASGISIICASQLKCRPLYTSCINWSANDKVCQQTKLSENFSSVCSNQVSSRYTFSRFLFCGFPFCIKKPSAPVRLPLLSSTWEKVKEVHRFQFSCLLWTLHWLFCM